MLAWISANLGTIVVCVILVLVVAAIIISMVRKKKRGESSCSCGGNCASCHAGCSHKV